MVVHFQLGAKRDLHERTGSRRVVHMHGELRPVRMSVRGNFRVRFGCLTGWMDGLSHAGWAGR
jgi:hypothetical protein